MAMRQVLLEDTWEADDVKEECGRLGAPCRELSVEELEAISAAELLASVYMCSTELCQRKLREVLSEEQFASRVPATYPEPLRPLLRRRVEATKLGAVTEGRLPLFVKPATNDKSFDGRVVRNKEGLERLLEEAAEECGGRDGIGELDVLAAEVVTVLSEHRLFVGGGQLYGEGQIREDTTAMARLTAEERQALLGGGGVPASFVGEVLALCGGEVFWAVDVGLLARADGELQWGVVEVNPPFALDDHGLAIEPYVRYCMDACAWIRAAAPAAA